MNSFSEAFRLEMEVEKFQIEFLQISEKLEN